MNNLSSKHIFIALGPILFGLVLQFHPDMYLEENAWRVVAIASWMIAWWVTEAVAIPITALLPLVLFPLTGVFDMKTSTAPYGSPIIFLFMRIYASPCHGEAQSPQTHCAQPYQDYRNKW